MGLLMAMHIATKNRGGIAYARSSFCKIEKLPYKAQVYYTRGVAISSRRRSVERIRTKHGGMEIEYCVKS